MRGNTIARALILGASLVLAAAKPVPDTVAGEFALAGAAPRATAVLSATPSGSPAGPVVPMTLSVAMTPSGAKKPTTSYTPELGHRLHLIAVSDDLRRFVHVHGDALDKRGRISTPIQFPDSGFYWVYADASPAGLGQQVFRFPLRVGSARGASAPPPAPPLPDPSLEAADGPYTVRLDPFALKAGTPASLHLTILRDGRPAADLAPYLGVAAHAILISARDHSYEHVHAMVAGPGDEGEAAHDMHGMAMAPPARVIPDLALRMTPSVPGPYRLWVQFMAGGAVRTVAFTVDAQ